MELCSSPTFYDLKRASIKQFCVAINRKDQLSLLFRSLTCKPVQVKYQRDTASLMTFFLFLFQHFIAFSAVFLKEEERVAGKRGEMLFSVSSSPHFLSLFALTDTDRHTDKPLHRETLTLLLLSQFGFLFSV